MEVLDGLSAVGPYFSWFASTSLEASVLILILLLIQKLLAEQLSPFWQQALWFLILIKLVVAPLTPPIPLLLSMGEPQSAHYPWHLWATFIWVYGMLFVACLSYFRCRRFKRGMTQYFSHGNATQSCVSDMTKALLENCKAELNLGSPVVVIAGELIRSPAMMGFSPPCLLLPKYVEDNFNADELRYILLHELAHHKRGDLLMNKVLSVIQVLHWLNPLSWIAIRALRNSVEEACDQHVMNLDNTSPRAYIAVIMKFLEFANQSTPASLVHLLDDAKSLKARLLRIATHKKTSPTQQFIGFTCFVSLAVLCIVNPLSTWCF